MIFRRRLRAAEARVAELEAAQDNILSGAADLYLMVQEGKRLLIRWKATSGLTKDEKLVLRRSTQQHLRTSSSHVVQKIWPV